MVLALDISLLWTCVVVEFTIHFGPDNIGQPGCFPKNRLHRGLVLTSLWLVFSMLPASNLLFTVGFTVAERVMYIPSIASSALLARLAIQGFHLASKRLQVVGLFLAIAVLLISSRSCLEHSKAWWTAERLYRSGLEGNPRNEKLHDLLATRLQNSGGNLQEARWHAEKAIDLNPDYWHAHATLGQLTSAGMKSFAIQHYQKALVLAERQGLDDVADAPKVRLNLAVMLQDADVKSAEYHFRRLCSMHASDIRAMALVIFGAFLESTAKNNSSRLSEAARMYEHALRSAQGQESVTHLRLGSVIRRIASLNSGNKSENGAKPVKLTKSTGNTKIPWHERFASSCSDGAYTLPSLVSTQTWLQGMQQCWRSFQSKPGNKVDSRPSRKEDLELVKMHHDDLNLHAIEAGGAELYQRMRRLLTCIVDVFRRGRIRSSQVLLRCTWL